MEDDQNRAISPGTSSTNSNGLTWISKLADDDQSLRDEMHTLAKMADDLVHGITERHAANWDDWLKVARVLTGLRLRAFRLAGTNEPKGSRYNRAMQAALEDYPRLARSLDQVTRAALMKIDERREEVERWRGTLTEKQRAAWQMPDTVWKRFAAAHVFRPEGASGTVSGPPAESEMARLREEIAALRKIADGTLISPGDTTNEIADVLFHQLAPVGEAKAEAVVERVRKLIIRRRAEAVVAKPLDE